MHLIRCSCGLGWVPRFLALGRLSPIVRLVIAEVVQHWRDGHRVMAPASLVPLIRAAARQLANNPRYRHQGQSADRQAGYDDAVEKMRRDFADKMKGPL